MNARDKIAMLKKQKSMIKDLFQNDSKQIKAHLVEWKSDATCKVCVLNV